MDDQYFFVDNKHIIKQVNIFPSGVPPELDRTKLFK
jgi:hypothetical protein